MSLITKSKTEKLSADDALEQAVEAARERQQSAFPKANSPDPQTLALLSIAASLRELVKRR